MRRRRFVFRNDLHHHDGVIRNIIASTNPEQPALLMLKPTADKDHHIVGTTLWHGTAKLGMTEADDSLASVLRLPGSFR